MKKLLIIATLTLLTTSCGLLKPQQVNAGYYIQNLPESKTTIQLGTSNSQANAVHAPIGKAQGEGDNAEAIGGEGKTAKASGLFVNTAVGDRAAVISPPVMYKNTSHITHLSSLIRPPVATPVFAAFVPWCIIRSSGQEFENVYHIDVKYKSSV